MGLLLLLIKFASATTIPQMSPVAELNVGLLNIASALGVLVITYAGIRWVASESPQEREDAKKTILYVIVGLIIVRLAHPLVQALYCDTAGLGTC